MRAVVDGTGALQEDVEDVHGVSRFCAVLLKEFKLSVFNSNGFDFLLGFSGISVVPRTVIPSIVQFLSQVYTNRDAPIVAFERAFTNDSRLGALTPVNMMYRENGEIRSKQIVYSNFKTRVWGLAPVCGNPHCFGLPGNIVFRPRKTNRGDKNHDFVSCICRACNWGTSYIQRPEWLKPLRRPFFFMHDYPLTRDQEDVFTSAMANMQ
jgi:hypothetical protein